jgi:F1F0 ATPase subunit 2
MTLSPLAIAFLAGLGLGALYFAALWASVRRLAGGAPTWAFALSALLRLGLVLGAVAGAQAMGIAPVQLVCAFLGFLTARLAATRFARPNTRGP